MRSLLVAGLLLSLATAGCSYETGRPDDSGGGGGDGGGGDGNGSDDGPPPEPESDSGVLDITIESDGTATLEVPFPTLDSCRSPEDWMAGGASVEGAVPELRDATGDRSGRVLALSTRSERAEWSVQIPLGPPCATFRHDPWSIDPDAENGTVEVQVTEGSVSMVTVLVRRVRDGSGEAVFYEGAPSGSGWTALPEKTTVPIGETT
ncbi:MAG TPA: hypothetical protein VJ874_07060 [Candidatus Thermoplasmatota archaeon]|nr:hypothetical protein [Candidatus Thermoplasmatota archaeon]